MKQANAQINQRFQLGVPLALLRLRHWPWCTPRQDDHKLCNYWMETISNDLNYSESALESTRNCACFGSGKSETACVCACLPTSLLWMWCHQEDKQKGVTGALKTHWLMCHGQPHRQATELGHCGDRMALWFRRYPKHTGGCPCDWPLFLQELLRYNCRCQFA